MSSAGHTVSYDVVQSKMIIDSSELTGDVVHLSIFSKHIVVLGSPQAIVDLLDHQSAVTSDRQQSPVLEL